MTQSTRSSSRPRVSEPPKSWAFEAIGTVWWIALYAIPRSVDIDFLYAKIQKRIQKFDAVYSRFRDDSVVSGWASQAGSYPLPADALPLLDYYKQLYDITDGAVTPLVGQVLSDAGYDAQYSLRPVGELVAPPSWDEAFDYDDKTIHIKQPVLLDFGAAGKGYLVDILCELLESEGVRAYCVDAGGDIRYRGPRGGDAFVVGLEHPDDAEQVIGVVNLAGGSICGAAGNRRAWSKYHHIIDPRRLKSPEHIKAIWVTAPSAMLADGLTTALYFTSHETLLQHFTFGYAIVHTDRSLLASGNFPAQFFTD
ncbi:MAG TPA: FAD:protein FMN transferase [Hymenobacter sp.]